MEELKSRRSSEHLLGPTAATTEQVEAPHHTVSATAMATTDFLFVFFVGFSQNQFTAPYVQTNQELDSVFTSVNIKYVQCANLNRSSYYLDLLTVCV